MRVGSGGAAAGAGQFEIVVYDDRSNLFYQFRFIPKHDIWPILTFYHFTNRLSDIVSGGPQARGQGLRPRRGYG